MPLVIEDGRGIEGAQAYAPAAEVVAWLAARGRTAFVALASEPMAGEALSKQEQVLDGLASLWKGDASRPASPGQGLFLPRDYLRAGEPIDGVPRWWIDGIALLAEAMAADELAGSCREEHWDPSIAAARGLRYRPSRPGFLELYPEAAPLLRRMLR